MAYYVRILSPNPTPVAIQSILAVVAASGFELSGDVEHVDWTEVELSNASGEPVLAIERNEVSDGSLAQDELHEFYEEIVDCLPRSGVQWLQNYLRSVKSTYAIQVLDTVYKDNGWEILASLKTAIQRHAGGIFQTDLEGFSNEDGYHIIWQFSEDVTGEWWMALLQHGTWQRFQMDLGSKTHRLAFQAGQIPEGVERAN